MNQPLTNTLFVTDHPIWDRMIEKRSILQFRIELTARCNNDCRHCYICLPSGDMDSRKKEPSFQEIMEIADQAIRMGALWCNITGGEPLIREDFKEIYLGLKKKGLLVSVYTNATLVREEHIELFKRYPPQYIEITVYGITKKTYEAVTRRVGSYEAFMRGLSLLLDNGVNVRLKAMALRSNAHEMLQISAFCRERTCDYFRFDPFLIMRLDRNPSRNREIRSERLTPEEIVALEKSDPERFSALEGCYDKLINCEHCESECNHIFHCGIGIGDFILGYDSTFRLCTSLNHPDCVYDLRGGSLIDAWRNLVPRVREMRSSRKEYLENCRICPIINLCSWCPALAYLEEDTIDALVPYFCQVAHARAEALGHIEKK